MREGETGYAEDKSLEVRANKHHLFLRYQDYHSYIENLMFESASLKIDRTTEHISELTELIREQHPFSYVVETNTQTSERATFAKKNKTVVDRAALICGEIVHGLRAALDHAYWEIVSPLAETPSEQKIIQFPFCEFANKLDETLRLRLAHKVSQHFFDAILSCKPYAEQGGNEHLYLIHRMDIIDKHRLLIPTGDYTRLTSDIIRRQVPDFPSGLIDCGFGQNRRDVVWRSGSIKHLDIGFASPPTTHIFEKKLDVPVEMVFVVNDPEYTGPVIPTLNKLVRVTKKTITCMREAIE